MPRRRALALPLLVLPLLVLHVAAPGGAAPAEPEHRPRPFVLADTTDAAFTAREARRLLGTDPAQGLAFVSRALQTLADAALLPARPGALRDAPLVLAEPPTAESERWRPLREVLEDLLAGLPPEGRARYEEFVAPQASALAERARASGSEALLRELVLRFPVSRASLDAQRALVERGLERGRTREAATQARRALAAAPDDAALWLRLVDALTLAADAQGLARLRPPAGLAAATALGPVDVAERLLAARRSLAALPATEGRPMWGGRPSRDLAAPAGEPTRLSLRWTAPTVLELRERDVVPSWAGGEGDDQADFEAHLDLYRPLFPAADARTLFVSDGRSVRALDLLSGRPRWVFDATTSRLGLLPAQGAAPGRTALERPFAPSLWRDRVIACVEVERPFVPEWLMQVQINTYVPRRALVALDRERGALLWAAGASGADRLLLEGVTFVSEPLVADGLVLAVGSVYSQVHYVGLYAFDAQTGDLVWRRPLAQGQQETNLFGNTVKELAAGAVSAADGTAYCLTGLGCLAAVDLADGALRWVASYAHQPIPKADLWYRAPLRVPRAGPSAPLVVEDTLVVAPGDGLHVSAYDRLTGELRWRVAHGELETPFPGLTQVLGVAPVGGRAAVLVTGGGVLALDLASGRRLARGRPSPPSGRVVGQGALVGREALVPTEGGLARFDLDLALSHRGTEPWPEGVPPGTLLPTPRVLVLCSRDSVHGLYAWEDVERDLERRRRERPRDPEVLLEAGELYLRGRGPASAREAFASARRLSPPGSAAAERARRGLLEAWMAEGEAAQRAEAADEAARAYRAALPEAATPAERVRVRLALDRVLPPLGPERRTNLEALHAEAGQEQIAGEDGETALPVQALALLRLARLEAEGDRPAAAVAALQRLLQQHGDVLLDDEPARQVAQERIAVLIRRHGAAVYAAQEAEARERLAAARARGGAAALLEVLERYPNASVVPEALLALGEAEAGALRHEQAAEVLRRLLALHPAAPEAPRALERLAEAYGALGASGARRAALRRRLELGAPETLPEALRAAALPPARARAAFRPPLVETASRGRPDEDLPLPLPVAAAEDEPCPLALVSEGGTLRAFALADGRPAFAASATSWRRAAYAQGTLLAAGRGLLLGLDPDSGAERWRRDGGDDVLDLVATDGLVVAWTQSGRPGRPERALEALDPRTGRRLWRTPLGSESYALLRADAGRVALQRARNEGADGVRLALLVFDGLTGALRAELPLASTREGGGLRLLGDGLLAEVRVEGGGRRVLTVVDLRAARVRFQAALPGGDPATALARDGARVHVLRLNGQLDTLALADGAPAASVRLALPASLRAVPQQGTALLAGDGRLTLLGSAANGPAVLACFALGDGALLWQSRPEELGRTSMHALEALDGCCVALWAGSGGAEARRVLVRVLRAADGALLQELEPPASRNESLAGLLAGEGALVVVTGAGTRAYGPPPADAAPAPQAR